MSSTITETKSAPERHDSDSFGMASDRREVHRIWWYVLAGLLIVLAKSVAFSPTLFNFFNGDDFELITSLKAVAKNPTTIFHAFCEPWLVFSTYYRPLVKVVLALEYFAWGTNGLYFRLSNVFYELLSSLLLFFIVLELSRNATEIAYLSTRTRLIWAFGCAALFALYPLHSEPVDWIVARSDILVNLFCLLSLWCYIRWQRSLLKRFFALSILSAVLALLCKEIGIIVAPLLFVYDLLYTCPRTREDHEPALPSSTRVGGWSSGVGLERVVELLSNWLSSAKKSLLRTLPYWSILPIYFCVRKAVIGKFVGVWDDSPALYAGQLGMLREVSHGIKQIFIPINASMITASNPISIIWHILIVISLLLSCCAFTLSKNKRLATFLPLWFVVSLVPVFRMLSITPDLLRARIAYLATAPLCLLLTYGVARFSFGFKYSYLVRAIAIALLSTAAVILNFNNQAFAVAGHTSNKIIEEFKRYYRFHPGDPQVRILGLPELVNGAGVSLFALDGMTKTPFQERDIYHCQSLTNHYSQSFGLLKQAVKQKGIQINFVYWDSNSETIKPCLFYPADPQFLRAWQGRELRSILEIKKNRGSKFMWDKDEVLHIYSDQRNDIDINLQGLPCWPTDFLDIKVKLVSPPDKSGGLEADLLYANDIVKSSSWKAICPWEGCARVKINPSTEVQDLIFPLGNLPDWALGGKCQRLELSLPAHCDLVLFEISVIEKTKMIAPNNSS